MRKEQLFKKMAISIGLGILGTCVSQVGWTQKAQQDTLSDQIIKFNKIDKTLKRLNKNSKIVPKPFPEMGDPSYSTEALPSNAFTLSKIRDRMWDDNAIRVKYPARGYPSNIGSGVRSGAKPPYLPAVGGIRPFQMETESFTNIFIIRSPFSRPMIDQSVNYGFRILSVDQIEEQNLESLYFEGTSPFVDPNHRIKWLKWRTYSWRPTAEEPSQFSLLGLPEGAFHLLPGQQSSIELDSTVYKKDLSANWLVLDMEHNVPKVDADLLTRFPELNQFPACKSLYSPSCEFNLGAELSYTKPIELSKGLKNWDKVSLYGWQPAKVSWSMLSNPDLLVVPDSSQPDAVLNPAIEDDWNRFGKTIFKSVDAINPSIYLTRWSARNVAASLATLDANARLTQEGNESQGEGDKRGIFPFLRPLFLSSGGDCSPELGKWRWYKDQPISDEEARALTTASFFSDIKGFGVWASFKETPNGFLPGSMETNKVFQINGDQALILSTGARVELKKYEVLFVRKRVTDAKGFATVTFEILPALSEDSLSPYIKQLNTCQDHTHIPGVRTYSARESALIPLLRPHSQPIAAMFEGMALVKPVEYLLFAGKTELDVSAQKQFGVIYQTPASVIVRRKKVTYMAPDQNGEYRLRKTLHIYFTYDPQVLYKVRSGSTVTVPVPGNSAGKTLTLYANGEPRIYLFDE